MLMKSITTNSNENVLRIKTQMENNIGTSIRELRTILLVEAAVMEVVVAVVMVAGMVTATHILILIHRTMTITLVAANMMELILGSSVLLITTVPTIIPTMLQFEMPETMEVDVTVVEDVTTMVAAVVDVTTTMDAIVVVHVAVLHVIRINLQLLLIRTSST